MSGATGTRQDGDAVASAGMERPRRRGDGGVRITGLVHTKNEERNIARALRSLAPICDELVVADMASTDRTREIAREFGARILELPVLDFVEPARAAALADARGEWVLRIDADEFVPPALARRLLEVADSGEVDVVETARLNFLFGRPIRHSGWAPDRHFFFFKPAALVAQGGDDTKLHVGLVPSPSARALVLPSVDDLSVWHFNYSDWAQFFDKLNRYTTIEALEAGVESSPRVLELVAEWRHEIWVRGLRGRSWRDGYRGPALVGMMCVYRTAIWLKRRQLREDGDDRQIRERYDRLADRMLAGSAAAGVLASQ